MDTTPFVESTNSRRIELMSRAYDRSMRKQGRKDAKGAKNDWERRKDGMGPAERKWGNEMSSGEKADYGSAMRAQRAAHGVTDGLRCSQDEFHDYLARKEAESERLRGARVKRPPERKGRQYPTLGAVRIIKPGRVR